MHLETTPVLKALIGANRVLAELKGYAAASSNQGIFIDTLIRQEAQASSAIENIVATQEELFRVDSSPNGVYSVAAREVVRNCEAFRLGYDRMLTTGGLITNNTLIDMFRLLMARSGGFRVTPGTVLKDSLRDSIVYVPPQDANQIVALMTSLERFIHTDDACDLDPLVRMALIHHQFESIHPFPDGNGRIGRILNALYLMRAGLLDTPALCLSCHVLRTRSDYYRLLRVVHDSGQTQEAWEGWVLYLVEAVTNAAKTTLDTIRSMGDQMAKLKLRLRSELPGLYSQALLHNLFRHPYTRISLVMQDLGVARPTATKYLNELARQKMVEKQKIGRVTYYINRDLVVLLQGVSGEA